MQTHRSSGFTLIELMIVVAIIAILAAIALPAYRDYAIRAKVSELLVAVSACKVSVTEFYQTRNGFPANQAESGCGDQSTKFVESLTVDASGLITAKARVGADAIDPIAAGNLALAPSTTVTGQLDWSCNGPATTIPKKFLPAACR
jgi:type IV pilus assembly protein PilA